MKKILAIILVLIIGIIIGWTIRGKVLKRKYDSFSNQLQKEINEIKIVKNSTGKKRSTLEELINNSPDYVLLKSNRNKNLEGHSLTDWGIIGKYRILQFEAYETPQPNSSELMRMVKRVVFFNSDLEYVGYYPVQNFGFTYKLNSDSISIADRYFDLRHNLPDSVHIGPDWYLRLVK